MFFDVEVAVEYLKVSSDPEKCIMVVFVVRTYGWLLKEKERNLILPQCGDVETAAGLSYCFTEFVYCKETVFLLQMFY